MCVCVCVIFCALADDSNTYSTDHAASASINRYIGYGCGQGFIWTFFYANGNAAGGEKNGGRYHSASPLAMKVGKPIYFAHFTHRHLVKSRTLLRCDTSPLRGYVVSLSASS